MSVTISTKVPEELAERIDAAQEEGESRSACIRRLVRNGLASEDAPHAFSLPVALMWGGSVAVAAQYVSTTGPVGPLGIAVMVGGYLLTHESINQRVRDRYAEFTGDSD